jgi:predicted PhzF superfamily epimerase YddE/YHI9
MPLPFHLVDAFTASPFAGNPAVVMVLPDWPDDVWLQRVAREMNQSETAFLVGTAAGFHLRWFTPKVEVELCGHATLASAHVLWESQQAEASRCIEFFTRSGTLAAVRRGPLIELDFPLLVEQPAQPPPRLSEALGVTPRYVGRGSMDLLVEVGSEAEVHSARPDFRLLANISPRGVILTSRASAPDFDFVSRFFAPAAGIDEDPVTGSAHCCLASFWKKRLGKSHFVAYQASERGGVVQVRVEGERAILGGQAVTVATGRLH